MTLSAGSASYGNQSAPAAPEVVCCPICAAKIEVRYPPSAKKTPQVKPETPAPTIATRREFVRVFKVLSDGIGKRRRRKGWSRPRKSTCRSQTRAKNIRRAADGDRPKAAPRAKCNWPVAGGNSIEHFREEKPRAKMACRHR